MPNGACAEGGGRGTARGKLNNCVNQKLQFQLSAAATASAFQHRHDAPAVEGFFERAQELRQEVTRGGKLAATAARFSGDRSPVQ